MYPLVRLDLFGWHGEVATYSLCLTLAALVAVAVGWLVQVRLGTGNGRAALLVTSIAVAVVVGARLVDVATRATLYEANPSGPFRLDFSGFSMYGGVLVALPAAAILARILALDPAQIADSLVPAAASGIAIAKVGCFLAGCCFGTPTTLPWGVTFPFGSEAHLNQLVTGAVGFGKAPLPVHPVQLYEATAAILGALAAIVLLGRRHRPGIVFLGFALWFSATRLLEVPLRASSLTLTSPDLLYPALYGAAVLLSGILLLYRLVTGVRPRGAHPGPRFRPRLPRQVPPAVPSGS